MAQKIDAEVNAAKASKPITARTVSGLCMTTLKLNPKKHAACKVSWCECSCHDLEGIIDPLTGEAVEHKDEPDEDLLALYYGV